MMRQRYSLDFVFMNVNLYFDNFSRYCKNYLQIAHAFPIQGGYKIPKIWILLKKIIRMTYFLLWRHYFQNVIYGKDLYFGTMKCHLLAISFPVNRKSGIYQTKLAIPRLVARNYQNICIYSCVFHLHSHTSVDHNHEVSFISSFHCHGWVALVAMTLSLKQVTYSWPRKQSTYTYIRFNKLRILQLQHLGWNCFSYKSEHYMYLVGAHT